MASKKLRDPELWRLHRSMVNTFSLAYAIELREQAGIHVLAKTTPHHTIHSQQPQQATIHYEPSPTPTLILYPSDIDGNALKRATMYYKKHAQRVIAEVAAHHGNAYTPELRDLAPTIILLPRCSEHTPRKTKGKLKNQWLRQETQAYTIINTEHTQTLEIEIHKGHIPHPIILLLKIIEYYVSISNYFK